MTTKQSDQLTSNNVAHFNKPAEDIFVMPVSFAQQRLWFLDQLDPENFVYNLSRAFRLTGQLNVTALEQSVNEVIARHEILRTAFATVEAQPVQVIRQNLQLKVRIIDLQDLSESKREHEGIRLATTEAQQPFDLTQAPLLRVTLLRLSTDRHFLLLTIHHIISDRWSMDVLLKEISSLYEAFVAGKPSPLSPLPIQYADFAIWQQEWLQGENLQAQLDYWKEELHGASPVLELPTDRPRPPKQTFRGSTQNVILSKSLTESIKVLSQQEKCTPFMTLLAAFKVLLYRYTGQNDISVGTPIANRNQTETEGLIGFFVNTLIMRTNISPNFTFLELLAAVRESSLSAYDHQDLPFEKLVESLIPERTLNRTPLFQVMFLFQNDSRATLYFPELNVESLDQEIDKETAKFDLTLAVNKDVEGFKLSFQYNTDLFTPDTITRMVGHFKNLLTGIVSNPDNLIATLPVLSPVEQYQLLIEWNNTFATYTVNKCLHQLFEAQVKKTPNQLALVYNEQSLTYFELNQKANQLAHYLQTLGVKPEVCVGICLERSPEIMIAILATLKSGGVYLPLEPRLPRERLVFTLKNSQAKLLLTQVSLHHLFSDYNEELQVVCVDTGWQEIARQPAQNPNSNITAKNLAYILFTSGSTGQPKGVAVEHKQIVHYILAITDRLELPTHATFATVSTFAADLGNTMIFPALTTGGCLHIISEESLFDPDALTHYFNKHSIDCLKIVPSHLAALLTSSGPQHILPRQRLVLGGEASNWELLDTIQSLASDSCITFNHYGPTETAVGVTTFKVEPTKPYPTSATVPLGRPIANTQIYILDTNLQPVPIGIAGELYIGGHGVTRGYLNHPTLTSQKYIPNQFGNLSETRLYKTGDRARFLPDGNIEFLGRIDHQIKIRGFRIELGEIEAVLSQNPAVKEALVIPYETNPANKHLISYVVLKPGYSLSSNKLQNFLKEKLPDYMIPAAFVILDKLPLTPNGKLDRKALPTPDMSRSGMKDQFYAPEDLLELQLAQIWENLLGIQPIGTKANFFELGGHSLLAVRLVTEIEKVTGKKLSLATLFQAPTIEQLANILRQEGWSQSKSSLVPLQINGSKPPFFCIPGNLGNVFNDLGHFVQHIDSEIPFYGFQDGFQVPAKIESKAAHYLDDLRAVQPKGPYFLGGICSGGVIAFEMAQQLQAQGEKVEFLALVEPSRPSRTYTRSILSVFRRIFRRFNHQSNRLLELNVSEQGTYLRLKSKVLANILAISRYTPKTYQGQINIFLTSDTLKGKNIARLNWGNLAKDGSKLHEIPGTHDAIVGDNDTEIDKDVMKILAQKISSCINTVTETKNYQ